MRSEDRHILMEDHCPSCDKTLKRRASRCGKKCRSCESRDRALTIAVTKEQNGNWKGGKTISSKGYVRIKLPSHPRCNKSGYIYEHIVVMEKILGRLLKKEETVHHRNGIRHDNTPSNLELWARSHHSGQRVEDLINWVVINYREEVISKLGRMVK